MKKSTRRLLSILLTLTMLLGLLPAMNLTALAANGVEITRVGDVAVTADAANVTAPTAFVGQPYSLQLYASGDGTLTWSNPVTSLPAGLTLDSDTGLISGTPTETAYSASYTIKVTNGTDSDSILVSFNCCEEADKPTIDTSALPAGYVGSFYYQTIEYGGLSQFETQISAGTLPPGLEFNKSQGKGAYIRGTPTTAGTYTFTVWVKNVAGETTKEFTMTIGNANVPPSIVTTGALDYGVVGQEYSYQLIATGTNTESNPITWSITSGALPAGLSLNESTGLISGTPTAAGTGQADIQAMNKAANGITNQAASASVSIAVYDLPAIEERSLPNGTLGQSYSSQSIDTTDATEVAVTSGSLPKGMTLERRGDNWSALSGTPAETGTFKFQVTATRKVGDDVIGTASQEYTLVIDGPAITTASLPNGTEDSGYNAQLTCTSVGDLTKTWSVESGNLPAGLSLDRDTGVISGTPTVTGTFNFTARLTVSNYSVDKALSITVDEQPAEVEPPTIVAESQSLPYAVVGREYSHQFTATGTQPITWSVKEGDSLPAGLTLNASTGILSGTPTGGGGQSSFTIEATNINAGGQNQTSSKYFLMQVYAPPAIKEKTLPHGALGQHYSSQSIDTTDATEIAVIGSLPAGMTLERKGDNWSALSGTPTETGTFKFQVTATRKVGDDLIGTASQEYTLVIDGPSITTTSLPNGTEDSGYNAQLTCTSVGDLTKAWSVAVGNLPAGLSLDGATGVISGTPTVTGKTDFTVRLTVSNYSVDKELSITVDEQPAEVEPPAIVSESQSLPYAVIGREYSHQFTATGTQPITWSVSYGSLPAGLTLNASTGLLSGTPTGSGGQSSFTIEATNINSGGQKQTSSKYFLMQVYAPPAIEEKTLSHGALGQSYSSQSIDTTDATEIAVIGSLPAGMTLERKDDNWSALSGTPTETGTFKFQVTATRKVGDDLIGTASQEYTLVIDGPAITTASLPNATQNSSYNAQLTCTSVGDLTKTWSVAVGNLPDGLSLNGATGVISGTPTVTGTFNFTARLTVSNYSVEQALSITVETQPETTVKPDITGSSALPYAVVGREYSHQFTATGTQPITWSVREGSSLPDGLELNANTGILSGTPTQSSIQDEFYLTASNSAGFDSERFYMQVYAPPAIEEKTLPDGKLNISYSPVCFAVENAYDDDTVIMITGGALPAGMELKDYGNWFSIGGTPTEYGTFTFQVTATRTIDTDVIGTDTRVFTLKIEGPPAAPTFTPPSYTSFMDTLNVNIYCDTPGAVIYFTMDGTDPSTSSTPVYGGVVTINDSCTIKAVAYNPSTGFYSEIVSAEYTKVDSPAAPTASPELRSFVGSTAVTLSCATDNTTIYYTTDGSEPVKGGGTSLIYSSPIAISADTTIKARAYLATDPSIYSDVAEFTYTKVEGYSVSGKVASYNGKNAFTVTLYETGTTTEKGKVTVTGTGASGQATQDFTLTGVASGTYDLVVTKAGHLTYTITGVKVESGNVDLTADASKVYSTITLLCGDIDGDGNINESDVSVIRYASNINKPVSSAANPLADVDGDGNVNESDVSIVRYAVHINKNTGHCTFVYAG